MTKTVNKRTKSNAGTILNIREIINCNALLLVIRLFVTTNPLIKKNNLTARAPEYVKLKRIVTGSAQKLLAPFNV